MKFLIYHDHENSDEISMRTDKYGQPVFTSADIFNAILTDPEWVRDTRDVLVDDYTGSVNEAAGHDLIRPYVDPGLTVEEWDSQNQAKWWMPDEYKELDIAEYCLSLCDSEPKVQRVGAELLLYQERGLFDLLKYLKYLVDTMRENNVIWGVGRGSSVASYVLFLLGVHRVDSMFYDLDIKEFLR